MLPGYIGGRRSARGTQTTHFSILDADGNRVAGFDHAERLVRHRASWCPAPASCSTTRWTTSRSARRRRTVRAGGRGRERVAPAQATAVEHGADLLEGERGMAILGSPGGSFIPTMVLLGTLNWIGGARCAGDRRRAAFSPAVLSRTPIFAEPDALHRRRAHQVWSSGHSFRPWPETIGNMQVITWDRATRQRSTAASDPARRRGAQGALRARPARIRRDTRDLPTVSGRDRRQHAARPRKVIPMSLNTGPRTERPREKLLRLGPATLSEAELLAILLQTGTRGRSAIDMARDDARASSARCADCSRADRASRLPRAGAGRREVRAAPGRRSSSHGVTMPS